LKRENHWEIFLNLTEKRLFLGGTINVQEITEVKTEIANFRTEMKTDIAETVRFLA